MQKKKGNAISFHLAKEEKRAFPTNSIDAAENQLYRKESGEKREKSHSTPIGHAQNDNDRGKELERDRKFSLAEQDKFRPRKRDKNGPNLNVVVSL